jgi:hypothetical protein
MPTGCPIKRKGLWTEDEKALLREMYGKVRVKEIARRLGRSVAAILQQACTKQGLVRRVDGISWRNRRCNTSTTAVSSRQ